jgi:nucleobase transporter 1/2
LPVCWLPILLESQSRCTVHSTDVTQINRGDYYTVARLSEAPVPNAKVINLGIGMEGIGCLVTGIMGIVRYQCFNKSGTGNATTSYSENIGAIGLTKVASRRVIQTGAVIMLFLGVFGKLGGIFATLPQPIVGGILSL